MTTITKTKSGSWKALIGRKGWPKIIKTFRIRRDAEDWVRTTADEIIPGIYVPRIDSEKHAIAAALDRYQKEISSTKRRQLLTEKEAELELLEMRSGNTA